MEQEINVWKHHYLRRILHTRLEKRQQDVLIYRQYTFLILPSNKKKCLKLSYIYVEFSTQGEEKYNKIFLYINNTLLSSSSWTRKRCFKSSLFVQNSPHMVRKNITTCSCILGLICQRHENNLLRSKLKVGFYF